MGVLAKALQVARGDFWPQDIRAEAGAYANDMLASARGITVNANTAFGLPAFYAVVHVLSEDVAKLPLHIYEELVAPAGQTIGGKRRASGHPLYPVLHQAPNPEMTSFVWREAATGHIVTWGNHYSEIVRNGLGQIKELWPLRPDRMSVLRDLDGTRFYRYRLGTGEQRDLRVDQVFHIPGFGFDGYQGYNLIEVHRRALALGLAAQEYGERMWNNGARPGGILTVPKEVKMSDTAASNLKAQFETNHAGLTGAQRISVLKDGIAFTEVGIPPEAAQYIESRKFSLEEIARMHRVPQHKVGGLEHATFSNIEEQNIEYVQDGLGGYLARWEGQIQKDLIGVGEPFFAAFNVNALLRGKFLERQQGLWIQRQAGTINADEWRDIEDRNPLPDGNGQTFLEPLNMTPVGLVPPGAQPENLRTPGTENPASPSDVLAPPIASTVPLKPKQPSRNGKPGGPVP